MTNLTDLIHLHTKRLKILPKLNDVETAIYIAAYNLRAALLNLHKRGIRKI